MREHIHDMNDDLLVKYLLEEASADEQSLVKSWLAEGGDNPKYFEQLRRIWQESLKLAAESKVDENEAWQRFKAGLRQTAEEIPVVPMRPEKLGWLRVAAAVFVVIMAGMAAYFYLGKGDAGQPVLVQSFNRVINDTLPDGSVVTLNKNSSLAYNSKLTGDTRSVTLQGEAFFNVTPDKSKPFVIAVNNVTVTVVGTSFNVKSNSSNTEVIVETGIVEVAKQQKAVRLKPKEKVVVPNVAEELVKQKSTDELYNYYRTGMFTCDDTPLPRVVEVLNEVFGSRVVIDSERLKKERLNTTLPYNLEEALKLIAETLKARIEKQGNHILIK
ncbi:FecR domain-containing protein [Foetidibacter luteolus]|uniref:FecR domain-containing protein n=1 Tax=Foetidibacter luteolus TaxID=2608880 RepID=UPI00129A4A80|nr:FecR domain-containing protein [Foetidibacter luteolus]